MRASDLILLLQTVPPDTEVVVRGRGVGRGDHLTTDMEMVRGVSTTCPLVTIHAGVRLFQPIEHAPGEHGWIPAVFLKGE